MLYVVDLAMDIYKIKDDWDNSAVNEVEDLDYKFEQLKIKASEFTKNPFYVNLSILLLSGMTIALVSIFGMRSFKELWKTKWHCFFILVLCMFHCGPIVLIIFSKYLYYINDIHRYNKLQRMYLLTRLLEVLLENVPQMVIQIVLSMKDLVIRPLLGLSYTISALSMTFSFPQFKSIFSNSDSATSRAIDIVSKILTFFMMFFFPLTVIIYAELIFQKGFITNSYIIKCAWQDDHGLGHHEIHQYYDCGGYVYLTIIPVFILTFFFPIIS